MLAGEDDGPSACIGDALQGTTTAEESSQPPILLREVKQEVKEELEESFEPTPPALEASVSVPALSHTPSPPSSTSVAVKMELIDAAECSGGSGLAVWESGGTTRKSTRSRKSSRRSKAKKPKLLHGQGSVVRTSSSVVGTSSAAGIQPQNAVPPMAGVVGMEDLSQVEREKVI